jgi:hypothetical protein
MKKSLLLLFAAIASLTVFSQQSKTEPHPIIFVESNTIDYGVVKKGSDGIRKLKFYNKGTAPLLITSCTPSCGCTAPDCPKDPILPGKFAFISVNYTKMNDLGHFTKSLSVTSNDPNQPGLTITIRGEVKE